MSAKYDSITDELEKCGEEWAKVEKELDTKPIEAVQADYDAEKEKFITNLKNREEEKKAANEDLKAKLKPKFDKIKEKVEAKKEQAAAEFKKGSYAEAISLYKAAATLLDDASEDFVLFKKEIAQSEAAIYGNIAFCFGKDKQDK